MSDAPNPTPAQPAKPQQEPESELQYVLSIISLMLGFLLLLGGLILFISGTAIQERQGNFRFVIAIGAFLFVLGAMLRLGAWAEALRKRSSHQALNSILMSVLAVAVAVSLNWIAHEHNFWRADLTQEGVYTLSEESRTQLASLERDVKLFLVLRGNDPEVKDVLDSLIEQYETASSHVKHEKIDPDKLSQREVETKLRDLELGTDVMDEDQVLGVVVQSGAQTAEGWKRDRSKHIPRADLWDEEGGHGGPGKKRFVGEQKISSAIVEVLEGKRPKLYVLSGHDEASPDDTDKAGLSSLTSLLRQKNHEVAELKVAQGEEVPDDCALLVVAAPQRPLTPVEVASVKRYLERGGDALLCLEAVFARQPSGPTQFMRSGLEELLKERGVLVEDRYIVAWARNPFDGRLGLVDDIPFDEFDLAHKVVAPLMRNEGRISLKGARPLKVLGTGAGAPTQLVKTGADMAKAVRSTDDPLNIKSSVLPGEEPGPFTVVVASEKDVGPAPPPPPPQPEGSTEPPPEQPKRPRSRLVVVGDVDWMTNSYLTDPRFRNLELFQNSAAWCMEREQKIVGKATRPRSYRLTMDEGTLAFYKYLSVLGLPTIALSLGMFVWLIRRR